MDCVRTDALIRKGLRLDGDLHLVQTIPSERMP